MANVERLTLPDGQWADLSTRLTWGQYQRINAALIGLDDGSTPDHVLEVASIWARVYTQGWSVRGIDGAPLELADDAWDKAPADTIEDITREAQRRWREWRSSRSPLVSAGPSPASAPESESVSESPS